MVDCGTGYRWTDAGTFKEIACQMRLRSRHVRYTGGPRDVLCTRTHPPDAVRAGRGPRSFTPRTGHAYLHWAVVLPEILQCSSLQGVQPLEVRPPLEMHHINSRHVQVPNRQAREHDGTSEAKTSVPGVNVKPSKPLVPSIVTTCTVRLQKTRSNSCCS